MDDFSHNALTQESAKQAEDTAKSSRALQTSRDIIGAFISEQLPKHDHP